VAAISEQAAALFYERLFAVAPAVKAMFPADVTEQRKKLMTTLAVVVNGLGNLEAVLPAASALAKRHVNYGAKPEHYPVVGGALLWTLEKGSAKPGRRRPRRPGPPPTALCPVT
jgi:hemoglobin-like flavoprotein